MNNTIKVLDHGSVTLRNTTPYFSFKSFTVVTL